MLRGTLGSYDFVVRFGGDEFICALLGTTLASAARHFAEVNKVLAASSVPTAVTAGLAELGPQDTIDDLVERADVALYEQRRAAR